MRELPGEQQPWVVGLGVSVDSDPFDTLGIRMPLKSKQLFHYCESRTKKVWFILLLTCE